MVKNYKFTEHSKQRFVSRFPNKVVDGDVCRSIKQLINNATLNKSIHNNTRFISQIHEKHGFDAIEFYINQDVVFVCRGEKLVTVYDIKDSIFNVEQSKRFRKRS